MIVIGVIDDYSMTRQGLACIFRDHFGKNVKVLHAGNLSEFKRLHSNQHVDLVIMGINVGLKEQCLEIAFQLRAGIPAVPLIVYDEHLHAGLAIPYFKLGVSGYFLKQSNVAEIIRCVETVLGGNQYLCSALFEPLLLSFHQPSAQAPRQVSLGRREAEIADLLCQGMATSSIAQTLGLKANTISTVKNKIFKKMEVNNIIELKDKRTGQYFSPMTRSA